MAIEWKYRGRIFNLADIESIRRLIAANPEASRWALSRKLCEEWDWKQANGALRDMVEQYHYLGYERAGRSCNIPRVVDGGEMKRRRVEVNVGELDQLLEGAKQVPLSDPDCEKIKSALHALVDALARPRSTEKSSAVLGQKDKSDAPPEAAKQDQTSDGKPSGHGRNGASAFESAQKVETKHQQLKSGDSCPECPNGKVYVQKEPKTLIRIVGQAPIQATVYNLERLRCNLCGQVFTAEPPEGVGADKYDETVGSMVAQRKYGSGMPFNRLEKLEQRLDVPLPATTQWEIVEEAAELLEPAYEERSEEHTS